MYTDPHQPIPAPDKVGLIIATEKLYHDALEVMKRKNKDYSGDNSTLTNFNVAADIVKISRHQSILTRLIDKVSRIGNLLNRKQMRGEVSDESILDTIEDLINYAAILHYSIVSEINKK